MVGYLDDFAPPFQGQNVSGGIVEAGIDKDQARLFLDHHALQNITAHAVLIHRNRVDLAAGKLHCTIGIRRDRLFHQHHVALADEQRCDKVKRLIRFRQDLDLAGRGFDAFCAQEGYQLLP